MNHAGGEAKAKRMQGSGSKGVKKSRRRAEVEGGLTELAQKIAKRAAKKKVRRLSRKAKIEVKRAFRQSVRGCGVGMGGKEGVTKAELKQMAEWAGGVRKASTVEAYVATVERARKWLRAQGRSDTIPFAPMDTALYLSNVASRCQQRGYTNANVLATVAAIRWRHEAAGFESPTKVAFVRDVARGAIRAIGAGRQQKSPITAGDMETWYTQKYCKGGKKLEDLAMLTRIALMKDGLMRFSDIQRVRFGDVMITSQDLRIFVQDAKTAKDKREGQWVVIAAFERPQAWDAYPLFLQLVARIGEGWRRITTGEREAWAKGGGKTICRVGADGRSKLKVEEVAIMCKLARVGGERVPCGNEMKYGKFVTVLKRWVQEIGKDPMRYAAHSCRRGGATEMKAMGVPNNLIQEAGRWRSTDSMKLYFDWGVEIQERVRKIQEARANFTKEDEGLFETTEEMGDLVTEVERDAEGVQEEREEMDGQGSF